MEIQSIYTDATLDEVLNDLSVRFIVNLPQEELVSRERVCFQIEEAHWYYEDFVREQNPALPGLSLLEFLGKIFAHNPMLSKWGMHKDAYKEFMMYKQRVPIRGAILLNKRMDKVVLVKGWKAGSSWSFPRGKINKDEADHICAVRETLEETGFDATDLVDPTQYLMDDYEQGERDMMLFLIPDVPEDFNFHPLARKEISEVSWFSIQQILASKRKSDDKLPYRTDDNHKENADKLRTFKVIGFIPKLTGWIKSQRRAARQRRNTKTQSGLYETEPESSAVEMSPPRPAKARKTTVANGTPATTNARQSFFDEPVEEATTPGPANQDDSLLIASAKLRDLIGIRAQPVGEVTPKPSVEAASRSLLAELQRGSHNPIPDVISKPAPGISIPVAALFSAMQQQPSQPQASEPQTPMTAIAMSPATQVSPASTPFNPSRPQPHQAGGYIGHPQSFGQQAHNSRHAPVSKQAVTILQRGQPLPDTAFQGPVRSPPRSSKQPDNPQQASQPVPEQSPVQAHHQISDAFQTQSQAPAYIQQAAPSPSKMAKRPLLTIDSFIPPPPSRPPNSAHTGTLLDILKGAAPPPKSQPPVQLQTPKSTTLLGGLVSQAIPDTAPYYGNKERVESALGIGVAPFNGGEKKKKVADPEHLAALMKSLGSVGPRKVSPPTTLSQGNPVQADPTENNPFQSRPALSQPASVPNPNYQVPNIPFNPANILPRSEAAEPPKTTQFDRRGTVKSEQASILLDLLKGPVTSPSAPTSTLPTIPTSIGNAAVVAASSNPPAVEKQSAAPMMKRTPSSLSPAQTEYLFTLLDNIANQYGV